MCGDPNMTWSHVVRLPYPRMCSQQYIEAFPKRAIWFALSDVVGCSDAPPPRM